MSQTMSSVCPPGWSNAVIAALTWRTVSPISRSSLNAGIMTEIFNRYSLGEQPTSIQHPNALQFAAAWRYQGSGNCISRKGVLGQPRIQGRRPRAEKGHGIQEPFNRRYTRAAMTGRRSAHVPTCQIAGDRIGPNLTQGTRTLLSADRHGCFTPRERHEVGQRETREHQEIAGKRNWSAVNLTVLRWPQALSGLPGLRAVS